MEENTNKMDISKSLNETDQANLVNSKSVWGTTTVEMFLQKLQLDQGNAEVFFFLELDSSSWPELCTHCPDLQPCQSK